MIVDSLLIVLATEIGYVFLNPFINIPNTFIYKLILSSLLFYLIFGFVFKVFTRINRYTNLHEIIGILLATTSTLIVNFLFYFSLQDNFSKRLVFFTYILSTFAIVLSRLAWRFLVEKKNSNKDKENKLINKTVIIGAGEGGRILYNSLLGSKKAGDIKVVGFVDDDPNKQKMYLSNLRVLGKIKDLPEIIKTENIDMVTIAIPSLSRKELKDIYDLLENVKVKVNL